MKTTTWLVRWKLLGMPAYLPDGQIFATIPEEAFALHLEGGGRDLLKKARSRRTRLPDPIFIWCVEDNQLDIDSSIGVSIKLEHDAYTLWSWGLEQPTQHYTNKSLKIALREGLLGFVRALAIANQDPVLIEKAQQAAETAC